MCRALFTVSVVLLLGWLPARADPAQEAVRASFKSALADARSGRSTGPVADEADLRSYALYAYLQAARLERAITLRRAGAADEIADFLSVHSDEPVSVELRRVWLARLAADGNWAAYARLDEPAIDDQAYMCHALNAQIRLGATPETERLAIEQWLTPRSAPDSCDPVFAWLRSRGALGPALIEQRARLALAAGEVRVARWLAKSLPEHRAAPLIVWAALLDNPHSAIDQVIAAPRSSVESQALFAGWVNLTRRDPDAAIARYERLVRISADAQAARSRYAQPLALSLSWNRRPEALDFFARVIPTDFDELTHEWHTRAALWAGDWARAAAAIAAMPSAMREQTRWRYWEARAAAALGAPDRARLLFEAVIPTDNYYALQAAARLEQRFTPALDPLPLEDAGIDALEELPAFIRARELLAIAEPGLAGREWRYGYERLAPAQRVHAVGLAARWGWHFQSIATAAGLALYNDYPLLYPRPFDTEVNAAARLTGLPGPLIYAVIRQESLYQPYAVSSAGAVGLMQLMPATAGRTARALKWRPPTRTDLTQPAVNVKLGAATLRDLVDRFDGQTALALAGYNAGPGAARRWLPDRALEADVWIENIPFNETRGYVQRVLWHSVVFAWLDTGEAQDVSSLLARIHSEGGVVAATRLSSE